MFDSMCQNAGARVRHVAANTLSHAFVAALLIACLGPFSPAWAQTCDLSGVWAARIDVPIQWRTNGGVAAGSGYLRLWSLVQRDGQDNLYIDDTRQCGRQMPDTASLSLFGAEHYNVAYAQEAFDADVLPHTSVPLALAGDASEAGRAFSYGPVTFALGVASAAEMQGSWPSRVAQLQPWLRTIDGEALPGMPAVPQTDAGKVAPPINVTKSRRAQRLFIASHVALRGDGHQDACDEMVADVHVGDLGGGQFLRSTVVGCMADDGRPCSRSDLALINSFQPSFRSGGTAQLHMVRLPSGSDCQSVRERLPVL